VEIMATSRMVMEIRGMSCNHCVGAVRKALAALPEVTVDSVELGRAVVTAPAGDTSARALTDAVVSAGYDVAGVHAA
jgi:copper chaperone CopZ